MSDPQTRPSTVELAETAAQPVRELNHRTRGPDAFTEPAERYRLSVNSPCSSTVSRNCATNSAAGSTPNTTPGASGPTTTPTPARP